MKPVYYLAVDIGASIMATSYGMLTACLPILLKE